MPERDVIECDVVIIGAGVAGLTAAIKLRQLAIASQQELSVCILEKSAEVGAHILSGAVLETRALAELFPDWKSRNAPIQTPVVRDEFRLLTARHSLRLPTPPQMRNHGNYIVSLGEVCQWLAREAETAGVQIFTGFAATDPIMENGVLKGVVTGDMGVAKDGSPKANYQPGVEIRAKVTLLAEGCRGSLAERVMKQFDLRSACDPQSYAIGIKEIWEINPELHQEGTVTHTVGYPLASDTYGGSFIYHIAGNRLAVGFVTGLDYHNPYLDPYMEFQTFKTHPFVARLLNGGKRISYGARALNEGGFQSIPALSVPGGAITGCSAGFMNVAKIKGAHTAMKSALCAAMATFDHIHRGTDLKQYDSQVKASWINRELYNVRNIRPAFHYGLWAGLLYSALDTYILKGNAPWTLHYKPDYATLKPAAACHKPNYPRPDGRITFDRMSSVYLSDTHHAENQPIHLQLKDSRLPVDYTLPRYAEPAQRYCPAGVYEILEDEAQPRFVINYQNCVHCKTCDIKEPSQNILWTPPEGGNGPGYSGM